MLYINVLDILILSVRIDSLYVKKLYDLCIFYCIFYLNLFKVLY